jgi:hypothetical protein
MLLLRQGLLILLLAGIYIEVILPKQFPFVALTLFILAYAFGDRLWRHFKLREGYYYGMLHSMMIKKPGVNDRRDYSYGSIEPYRLTTAAKEKLVTDANTATRHTVWATPPPPPR